MEMERYATTARMSKATKFGGVVYLAGLVAEQRHESIAAETREILASIDAYLAEAGSDKSRLLSAMLWVSDMAYYDEMNREWDSWLPSGSAPPRACVEARLARDYVRVEIMVTAAAHS
jgi:enamine deaminase RidA (YjgF/YER057c/UK114 family)